MYFPDWRFPYFCVADNFGAKEEEEDGDDIISPDPIRSFLLLLLSFPSPLLEHPHLSQSGEREHSPRYWVSFLPPSTHFPQFSSEKKKGDGGFWSLHESAGHEEEDRESLDEI